MNKMLIAAAAAFFAIAGLFGSGAQAGFNVRLAAPAGFSTLEKAGCGGGYGYYRSYRRHAHRSVRRRRHHKVYVASKPAAEKVSVAKTEPAKAAEPVKTSELTAKPVESENSSISVANGKVAEAAPVASEQPQEKKVVASKNIGCKQFFPSVGMTLSVSCE